MEEESTSAGEESERKEITATTDKDAAKEEDRVESTSTDNETNKETKGEQEKLAEEAALQLKEKGGDIPQQMETD